jgi:hypothetical protein
MVFVSEYFLRYIHTGQYAAFFYFQHRLAPASAGMQLKVE